MSSAASRRETTPASVRPRSRRPGALRGLAAVTEHRGADQLWFLQPGRSFVRDDPARHLQQDERLGSRPAHDGAGIYIIEGGGFSVSDQASVAGSGVMIVNAGSNYPGTGGTYGKIEQSDNSTINLSPLTSGPYAGIAFFQPLDNTKSITLSDHASGITGTIYAPGAALSMSDHASLNASLIVDTITISDNGVAGPSTAAPARTGTSAR